VLPGFAFVGFCASYSVFSPAVARWMEGMLLISDPQDGGTDGDQKPDGPSVDTSKIDFVITRRILADALLGSHHLSCYSSPS